MKTDPQAAGGIYDPSGTGRVLFAFFAAMAETERENIREATGEYYRTPHQAVAPRVWVMLFTLIDRSGMSGAR
ncbi:hypothetical protein GCM10023195_00130 [Actinoallomurus liliacearum]|uniref:Uncharacterized protein n=1 Tax=Actinoallomurus liliacearum TaxID=1080073 RepID=A0ABP8TBM5_9ACTN